MLDQSVFAYGAIAPTWRGSSVLWSNGQRCRKPPLHRHCRIDAGVRNSTNRPMITRSYRAR